MPLCEPVDTKIVHEPSPLTTFLASTRRPPTVGPPTTPNSSCLSATLIANTGSTAHFCTIDTPVINQQVATQPITIRNPNGTIMTSTHTAELDLPNLPLRARQVHIVPALAQHSLISIGQLCDAGCDVAFDATTVTVRYLNNIVLTSSRNTTTKLWHLQFPPTTHQANGTVGSATPA